MSLDDLRIDVDDDSCSPNGTSYSSFPNHRRSSSLPLMILDGSTAGRCSFSSCCSFYSYNKLPEEPLKLSVLKLDGSVFEIRVMKSATVGELKQAVEDFFSHMPKKGPGKISWPHVWGHFCLSFDGQKLLTETDHIINYGIRDGHQLRFIRHVSTTYSMTKKRSVKQVAASESPRISLSPSDRDREREQKYEGDDSYDDVENGSYQPHVDIDDYFVSQDRVSWCCLFRRWYTYSRLPTMARTIDSKTSPARSACGFLGSFRRIIQFYGNNRKDTWED